jgi:hypothetical protein
MITYFTFKRGVEKTLGKDISNDEMIELCAEPLFKLLQEKAKENNTIVQHET